MPEKLDLETRETLFRLSVSQFINDHDKKELQDFADYWTEPNRSSTKMKWELEKTWELSRRIKRWFNNKKQWNGQKSFTPVIKLGTSEARIKRAGEW